MKKRLLCLFLLCAVLICGCTAGEDTSPGDSQSAVSSEVTSSEASADSSGDASSEVSEPETDPQPETPPEETDFFTANGQGTLPEGAVLPAVCTETASEYLYAFPLELPEFIEEIDLFTFVGNTVHVRYAKYPETFSNDITFLDVFYRVYSAETGELLTEKLLPQGAYSGPTADGGFWYAMPEGISLTRCDPDGTETILRQASNGYTGASAPYLLALSPDGGTLLAGFGASKEPFLLLDLATGIRTRISADVGPQSWSLLSADEDSFLLAGSRGALLRLAIGDASAEVLAAEGDPVGETAGDLALFANVSRGLVLRGQATDGSGPQLVLTDFLTSEETVAALDFGICVTGYSGTVRAYDLRTGACFASARLADTLTYLASFREDGLALVTDGVDCYYLDLPAAYAASDPSDADTIELTFLETDSLDAYFAQIVESFQETYGIALHIGSEGNDFNVEGYVGRVELEPVVIYDALQRIRHIFSLYPEGMLRETYEGLCESLQLYLCADLYGYAADGLSKAGGLTSIDGQNIIMAIDVYNGLETTLPHELSHVFDVRIAFATATGGLDWMQLWQNMHSFSDAYAFSYTDYYNLDAYTYYGETSQSRIWFADSYSRTFPTEDRARIIENLFNPVDGALPEVLQAPHLLEKARFYSYILRQCFPSCAASTGPLYWETYLGTIDENAVSSFLPAA